MDCKICGKNNPRYGQQKTIEINGKEIKIAYTYKNVEESVKAILSS